MVNKKLLFLFIFSLIFIASTQADSGFYGTFQQNKCINLVQICADCSYNNISSVNFPNSSQAIGQTIMTKTGTKYNYSFCNTTALGVYTINGQGDPASTTAIWTYDFEITPTGDAFSTAQGILYIFMLIVMIGLFLFTSYAFGTIQGSNVRNSDGDVLKVNWKKYLKMFCFALSYLFLVWIVFLAWNLAYGYLQMRGLGLFFKYVFTLLLGLALPIFTITIIFGVIAYVRDLKYEKIVKQFSASL